MFLFSSFIFHIDLDLQRKGLHRIESWATKALSVFSHKIKLKSHLKRKKLGESLVLVKLLFSTLVSLYRHYLIVIRIHLFDSFSFQWNWITESILSSEKASWRAAIGQLSPRTQPIGHPWMLPSFF